MMYGMSYELERGSETYYLQIEYGAVRADPGLVTDIWAWIETPQWAMGRYPHNCILFALTQSEEDAIREAASIDLEMYDYD